MPTLEDTTAFEPHNHVDCRARVMERARDAAKRDGLRLTPVRAAALEFLLASHKPMGAYDLLEKLEEAGYGNRPPVAYRALEFLLDNGFAHKIERLNAYIACGAGEHKHMAQFLICDACGRAAELADDVLSRAVEDAAARRGFSAASTVLEILGRCPQCREQPESAEQAE